MVLYSFYIFDRHTQCIYSRRWTPTSPLSTTTTTNTTTSSFSTNANKPPRPASQETPPAPTAPTRAPLSRSDDEKLVFGLVFSLRNLVQKLGGSDDTFLSYRTGEYKLHYYETPTRMKFVMLTDTKVINLRQYLHQIWANLYVEYVVKNPLAPTEHPGGIGVANELFERGLERFIEAVLPV